MNLDSWKEKARKLKSETYALYLASRHPKTPWYAKAFAVLILGYALSPIDLIPDFIPVIGYLDDFFIVPAGIVLLIKMIPKEVMQECRAKAASSFHGKESKNWVAAVIIAMVWLLAAYLVLKIVI